MDQQMVNSTKQAQRQLTLILSSEREAGSIRNATPYRFKVTGVNCVCQSVSYRNLYAREPYWSAEVLSSC